MGETDLEVTSGEEEENIRVQQMLLPMRDACSFL
jgi:hypothetical protein